MKAPRRALAAATGAAVLVLSLAAPSPALAHGLVGKRDVPIPDEYFFIASVVVLLVSFVLLGVLWRKPLLDRAEGRRVIGFPPVVVVIGEVFFGLLGIFMFGAAVYAGLSGVDSPTANLAPTAIYVLFWVGLVPISVLFGDVFRVLSPWRAVGRFVGWTATRVSRQEAPAPLAYPKWLGYWPAALGLLVFAWVELVWSKGDEPFSLAILALIYAGLQLLGMSLFGVAAWIERGDSFGVYYNLLSRLSAFNWRRDGLSLRIPLAGLSSVAPAAGLVVMVAVVIGTTAFDGASGGELWNNNVDDLQTFWVDAGTSLKTGLEIAFTEGLLFFVLLVLGVYSLGVLGMKLLTRESFRDLGRFFAPSLVPIAFAYIVAHYFSFAVYQGQAMGYLISDPLGDGSDIFGTATATIDYTVVGPNTIWWVQVAALVVGHVAALAIAHDRALVRWSDVRTATISQVWMLAVMVGFTMLGLWLLSAANA